MMISGYSPKEILELQKVGDWTEVNSHYQKYGTYYLLSNRVLNVLLVAALVVPLGLEIIDIRLYRSVGPVVLTLAFVLLAVKAYRHGHHAGYMRGYGTGLSRGVTNALQITDQEQEVIQSIVMDEEIDEIGRRARAKQGTSSFGNQKR